MLHCEPLGRKRVILLTEHWSRGSAVDLGRVALYTIHLMRRHPGVPVIPVMLIADRGQVPDRLTTDIDGEPIFDLRLRVISLPDQVIARWERQRNPVLAVLSALLDDLRGPASAARATHLLIASPHDTGLVMAMLPLIDNLASL